MQDDVEIHEKSETRTSSPGPIPHKENLRASVALATATQCDRPVYEAYC